MTAQDFKPRFLAALPTMPVGLDLHLDEFVVFENADLSGLAEEDAVFLVTQGLPRDASPFLSFAAYTQDEIEQRLETFALPQNIFPIGHNGSGDILAIDKDSGEVVYFNHDANNLRVFINSSLLQFAECLCVYQEHLISEKMRQCIVAIAAVDSAAALTSSMWNSEIIAEVTNS
jgi:hypothetical protein